MAEKKTAAKGYQKFKADLAAGTLGEVYIFCGEESYLRQTYVQQLQELLITCASIISRRCRRSSSPRALRSSISTASRARA